MAADDWTDGDPDEPGDYFWNGLFGLLKIYGRFGVALLSRRRERAADAATAELTEAPAALAATLERPTGPGEHPEADLREWKRSTAVIDILPPAEPNVSTGPFRIYRRPRSGSNIPTRQPNPPKPRGEPRLAGNS